ncbi:hypothetical protein CVS40_11283 [Lucilia cuprina]|nr:hypothetical protein CVS40_11283 [Lucilia cuprina]
MGKTKPKDLYEYLEEFTSEMSHILSIGIILNDEEVTIKIWAIICDAPARAFISGTPSLTSRNGCSKCIQVAKKIDGTLTLRYL